MPAASIFDDKIVLVTGANRGIGKALVDEALTRGARRVYAGTRAPLTHADARVTALMLDVSDPDQVRAAAVEVESLDVLINNAGVMVPDNPFDPAVHEQHLAVNLYGANAMTHAVLPTLIDSRGTVINLLSCAALAPLPMFSSYSASKAAAFSLTKTLRAAHASRGVRFHAVLAGPIDTDMTRALDIPKMSAAAAAQAIMDAVENEVEDIFPDPATAHLSAAWAAGADKILERQFAQLVQAAGR